jgi:hypothetical protein
MPTIKQIAAVAADLTNFQHQTNEFAMGLITSAALANDAYTLDSDVNTIVGGGVTLPHHPIVPIADPSHQEVMEIQAQVDSMFLNFYHFVFNGLTATTFAADINTEATDIIGILNPPPVVV